MNRGESFASIFSETLSVVKMLKNCGRRLTVDQRLVFAGVAFHFDRCDVLSLRDFAFMYDGSMFHLSPTTLRQPGTASCIPGGFPHVLPFETAALCGLYEGEFRGDMAPYDLDLTWDFPDYVTHHRLTELFGLSVPGYDREIHSHLYQYERIVVLGAHENPPSRVDVLPYPFRVDYNARNLLVSDFVNDFSPDFHHPIDWFSMQHFTQAMFGDGRVTGPIPGLWDDQHGRYYDAIFVLFDYCGHYDLGKGHRVRFRKIRHAVKVACQLLLTGGMMVINIGFTPSSASLFFIELLTMLFSKATMSFREESDLSEVFLVLEGFKVCNYVSLVSSEFPAFDDKMIYNFVPRRDARDFMIRFMKTTSAYIMTHYVEHRLETPFTPLPGELTVFSPDKSTTFNSAARPKREYIDDYLRRGCILSNAEECPGYKYSFQGVADYGETYHVVPFLFEVPNLCISTRYVVPASFVNFPIVEYGPDDHDGVMYSKCGYTRLQLCRTPLSAYAYIIPLSSCPFCSVVPPLVKRAVADASSSAALNKLERSVAKGPTFRRRLVWDDQFHVLNELL